MARTAAWPSLDFCQSLLETYAVNDRINQLILENLDPHAWRAKPPGRNVRTIAAIFAHMHNVRRKWLRLSARHIRRVRHSGKAPCVAQKCSRKPWAAQRVESSNSSETVGPGLGPGAPP